MPNTYSFYGSATYSTTVDTLDDLMAYLPDNNANLIDPKDLRDTAYTLWDRIDILSASVSAGASVSALYDRATPTLLAVGGANVGTTFSGSIQSALDKILYPYITPLCSLSGGGNREFGLTTSVTLAWSVTKNSDSIFAITVDGTPVVPTGNSQSGVQSASAIQDVDTTFTMSTTDGTTSATASTTVTWLNRRYWGIFPTFTALNSAQILGLTGAGVGSGNELSTTKVQTRDGINGAGSHIVFAWPTTFGTPSFIVNGFTSTAWTKINNTYSFTNTNGYITNYDVWISNTIQNSPITTFQIN